jgi:hypothetical protein
MIARQALYHFTTWAILPTFIYILIYRKVWFKKKPQSPEKIWQLGNINFLKDKF